MQSRVTDGVATVYLRKQRGSDIRRVCLEKEIYHNCICNDISYGIDTAHGGVKPIVNVFPIAKVKSSGRVIDEVSKILYLSSMPPGMESERNPRKQC